MHHPNILPYSSSTLIPAHQRPLLFNHNGRTIFDLPRREETRHESGSVTEKYGKLSQKQMKALNAVQSAARENQFTITMEPGDMVFINNHALLHSRDAFEDNKANSRHVVRMWIKKPSMAWDLPFPLRDYNAKIYDNDLSDRWTVAAIPKLPIPWNHLSAS
jgi:hypothetical protein